MHIHAHHVGKSRARNAQAGKAGGDFFGDHHLVQAGSKAARVDLRARGQAGAVAQRLPIGAERGEALRGLDPPTGAFPFDDHAVRPDVSVTAPR